MRSSNLPAVSPEMPYCRRSAGTTAMLLAILLTSSLVAYRAMEGARLTPPNRHAPLISHSFGLGALQLIASCFVYTVAPWTVRVTTIDGDVWVHRSKRSPQSTLRPQSTPVPRAKTVFKNSLKKNSSPTPKYK